MSRRPLASLAAAAILAAGGWQAVRSTGEYRAAVAGYLAAHPVCEHAANTSVPHSPRVAVHHRVPVHVAPWMAADTNNMITLCDPPARASGCHYRCGHPGGWDSYSRQPDRCRRTRHD